MRSIVFIVPGTMRTLSGGYIYNRHMVEGLADRGWAVEIRELDGSFPWPTPDALAEADAVMAGLAPASVAVVDSLALGAMPHLVVRESQRVRIVALMHLPLTASVGLDAGSEARFDRAERQALRAVSRVVVTGTAALPLLSRYDLAPDHVAVVEPGVDAAPLARGSSVRSIPPSNARPHTPPVHLVSVATVNQGKGHDVLLRALAALPRRNWRLSCVGNVTRDAATVSRLRTLLQELHLTDQVSLVGELEGQALDACYDSADIFVLASLRETYGMAVAEALARGLPVVGTATGAIQDLVGSHAGLVVPPGDVPAMTDALARVIGDPDLRARLAEGARAARNRLPSWAHAVGAFADVLAPLVGSSRTSR